MKRNPYAGHGPRKPSNETYPIIDAFAAAVFVDDAQGFVKRREGYTDRNGVRVEDNFSAARDLLRDTEQMSRIPADVRSAAEDLLGTFRERMILYKLAGTVSDYDKRLAKILDSEMIDVNSDLGMIASLPNSKRVNDKRQQMNDLFDALASKSNFIGKPKEQLEIEATVVDAMWQPKSSSYIITATTDDNNVIKFFMAKASADAADLSGLVDKKRIRFIGKVRGHTDSIYTNCKETIFNHVKIK